MPFVLNTKQLFLTWPECELPKEQAFELLTLKYDPEKLVVAHELHQNGHSHLHCYMKLKEAIVTKDPHFYDLISEDGNWHGNYQGCRSVKNVLKYCTKKEDFIANFDVGTATETKIMKKIVSHKVVHENIPLTKLVQEFPELLFGYKKLKSDIEEYEKDVEDQREDLPKYLKNPWGELLDTQVREKRRHYWIFSRMPNKGKTTKFALPLEENYRCYVKAGDYTYWSLRGDEQAVILDEYNTAALKWSVLNCMCDGTHEYRIFQGGVRKLKNPLIIVLSNTDIESLYPHMAQFLLERFNVVEII